MSPFSIVSTLSSLFQSGQTSSSTTSVSGPQNSGVPGVPSGGSDFKSSLALQLASLETQTVSTLTGLASGNNNTANIFDYLIGTSRLSSGSSDINPLTGVSSLQGLSATGRNMSLFDPESAYRMMTAINNGEITYKAQYSELSALGTAVTRMQQAGQTLTETSSTLDTSSIKATLQSFVGQYNDWIGRFESTVQENGILDGTQAAEISLYELEQNVSNIFNGAANGIHGLKDLGVSIDKNTHSLSLDTGKLDAVLTKNKSGVVNALQEFGTHFAQSAELLNSENNFIKNRLANLDHVIDYIGDNKSSLQAEFGLGDTDKPSTKISEALATYNRIFRS